MTAPESANLAAELANGVRSSEQVAATLGIQATRLAADFQVPSRFWHRRYQIVAAGWIVVRQSNGWRKSIPFYRRRAVPTGIKLPKQAYGGHQ
jgi:hypothetical protein